MPRDIPEAQAFHYFDFIERDLLQTFLFTPWSDDDTSGRYSEVYTR